MTAKLLSDLFKEMPLDAQREVREFVEFLISKHDREPGEKLRQDWAGALQDYRGQYSALELQEKAREWRENRPSASD